MYRRDDKVDDMVGLRYERAELCDCIDCSGCGG